MLEISKTNNHLDSVHKTIIMSATQVKEQIQKYIDQADERMIRAIYAMLQNYFDQEEEIVAFTVNGKPLTKKDMLDTLNQAVTDVENGKGLTSDDIRKEKKNW